MPVPGSKGFDIFLLKDRVKKIEEYLQKKDKKFKESITLNQKLLLLAELGIVDYLLNINDNKKMVAKLLAVLLDVSEQNLREELSHYQIIKGSNLYTENNMAIICDLLEKTKFHSHAEKVKNQMNKESLKKL